MDNLVPIPNPDKLQFTANAPNQIVHTFIYMHGFKIVKRFIDTSSLFLLLCIGGTHII